MDLTLWGVRLGDAVDPNTGTDKDIEEQYRTRRRGGCVPNQKGNADRVRRRVDCLIHAIGRPPGFLQRRRQFLSKAQALGIT